MWPIILWPGRTARPSTCQSRTSVSHGCGSVNPPWARSVSTIRPSWVVVATYAHDDAAGARARRRRRRRTPRARACRARPGRRCRAARPPGSALDEVADGERPGRVGPPSGAPKNCATLRRAIVGELLAALEGRHVAVRADRAQQRAGQRAGAGARLDDPGAREDVGHRDDLRGVLGVDDGRAARHRDHELAEQRAEDEVLAAARSRSA